MGNTPYLSVHLDPSDSGLGEESYGHQHQAQDEAFCKAMRKSMSHAGIAQRERRQSLPEVAGSTPVARSTVLQAFAAGLGIDPRSRALGRRDGANGWPNKTPPGCDALSYYAGYRDGELFGAGP